MPHVLSQILRRILTIDYSPDATSWSLHGRSESLESSEERMMSVLRTPANNDRRSWMVYISGAPDPDQCIGVVTLRPPDDDENESTDSDQTWELGYAYRAQHWGQGYATESCVAAIGSLKEDLDVFPDREKARLEARVHVDNESSKKVLEKLDFRLLEHRKLGGPLRFLAGQWREDGYLLLARDL